MPLSWFYWYLRIHCFSMTRIPFLFFQSECNFRKARYSWYWILLTTCTSCVTFSTYLACLSCHFLLCAMWVTCLSPRVTRMKWDHVNKWYVTEKMLNTLCLSCFPSITLASPNCFPVPISFKHLDADLLFLFVHWLLNTCLFSTCHSFLKALDFPWILTSSSQHRKIQEKKEWWRGNSFTLNGFKSGVLETRTESDHRMENKENKYKSMEEMSKQ